MIKIFKTRKDYDDYNVNGLPAGGMFYVIEDRTVHFRTNNIDGVNRTYDIGGRECVLTTKDITENGTYSPDDADGYSEVMVNVQIPEGYIKPTGNVKITNNGDFNIANYKMAIIDVPAPEGYIYPSGSKDILENGTNINISKYKYVNVNVPQPQGNIDITANGEVNVANYSTANVNVPIPEGYIYPSGTLSITHNGNLNVRPYETVKVNVQPKLIEEYIIENGTYTPSGAAGFSSVIVNVPNSGEDDLIKLIERDIQGKFVIPSVVDKIGNGAFSNCTELTEIVIPDTVEYIGDYAFYGCDKLGKVIMKNPIPCILGNFVFDGNAENRYIYVPNESVERYKTTENWTTLADYIKPMYLLNKFITYKAPNKLDEVTEKNKYGLHVNAFNTTITSHTFEAGVGIITFEGDVTSIGEYAFKGCYYLTEITIPDGVTSIGESAFSVCSRLTRVNIPDSVTEIGNFAFSSCSELKNITLSKNISKLNWGVFNNSGLTNIVIPDSVTEIWMSAFYGCGIQTITIPSSVRYIRHEAFKNCVALKTVIFGNTMPRLENGRMGCTGDIVVNSFDNNSSDRYFYVPDDKLQYWLRNASEDNGWIVYKDYIKPISELPSSTINIQTTP